MFSTRSSSPAKWQTSVDVPPMSNPMIRPCPAVSLVRTAPTTPPAGPDRIASFPWKFPAPVSPPEDCMNMSLPPMSPSNAAATRSM